MCNLTQMFFYQLGFKNNSFISERDLAMRKNTNFGKGIAAFAATPETRQTTQPKDLIPQI